MASKRAQRLLGLFMLLLGAAYSIWDWRNALATGIYRPKVAFLFPAVAVLGVSLLLFPVSKEELLRRYGVEKPSSLNHYSTGQKICFVLALLAGALNWALISGRLG